MCSDLPALRWRPCVRSFWYRCVTFSDWKTVTCSVSASFKVSNVPVWFSPLSVLLVKDTNADDDSVKLRGSFSFVPLHTTSDIADSHPSVHRWKLNTLYTNLHYKQNKIHTVSVITASLLGMYIICKYTQWQSTQNTLIYWQCRCQNTMMSLLCQ